jgi:hypothetical protein
MVTARPQTPVNMSTRRSDMKIAASTGEKVLGVLMIASAVIYLIPFVRRWPIGWRA